MSDRPWYAPRKPDEITDTPWLHPAAVEYLAGIVTPEMRVVEHGAGGSTVWFSERVKEVICFETSIAWAERVHARANGVRLYMDLSKLGSVGGFDLLMIDGAREERGKFLRSAHLLVRPGGWVVLDNANRPEYAAERAEFGQRAVLVARFDNNIPISKYFVTEFWRLCG